MDNKNTYYLKLGEVIEKLRISKDMTKKELSQGICSYSYITRIEAGQRSPNPIILRQISNRLGVDVDYLFRYVESPDAMEIQMILDRLTNNYRRNDYQTMQDIIDCQDKKIKFGLRKDLQSFLFYKIISNSFLNKTFLEGYQQLQNVLHKTYKDNSNPNQLEFKLMHNSGFMLLLGNKNEEAYEYLKSIESFATKILFSKDLSVLAKYYLHLATACVDTNHFKEAAIYIETAIDKCKFNNNYYFLTYLYYLKSELSLKQDDKEESDLWLDNAKSLYVLIKEPNRTFNDGYIETRMARKNN